MTRMRMRCWVVLVVCAVAQVHLPVAMAADKPVQPEPMLTAGAKPSNNQGPAASNETVAKAAAATQAQVAADKARVQAAVQDPQKAFDDYLTKALAQAATAKAAGQSLPPHLALLTKGGKDKRFEIFKANLQTIADLNNASGPTLAYGINSMTHLTPDEFKAMYLNSTVFPSGNSSSATTKSGGRRLLYSQSCGAERSFPYSNVSPPANIDWIAAGQVTPVKNQRQCGSCAAFAATAATESAFIARWGYLGYNKGNTDLSEQDLLDCTAGDQCNGATLHEYLDRMSCNGIAYESAKPYIASDTNSCPSSIKHYLAGITGYAFVPRAETSMKRALSKNPVVIGVGAGNSFQYYTSGVFTCSGNTGVNHAITVVGYSSSVRMSSGQTWRVWNVKNSWGTGWGQGGYVQLRADCGGAGSLRMYEYNSVVPIRG